MGACYRAITDRVRPISDPDFQRTGRGKALKCLQGQAPSVEGAAGLNLPSIEHPPTAGSGAVRTRRGNGFSSQILILG